MKIIGKILLILIFKIFNLFPINRKKVILGECPGIGFDGNVKRVYEELKKNKDLQFICISLKKQKFEFCVKEKLKQYSVLEIKGIWHLATSGFWFSDSVFFSFFPLKKEQNNIQLWHGAGAFKKFGRDVSSGLKYYITFLSVSSNEVIDIYANAFRISKEKVRNLGIPRADIFFREEEKQRIREEFYKNYPELKNKKIILYAPTFRDNEKNKFNLKLDIELMKENLEGLNYILLLKLHPGIKSKDIQVDNKFSYNFSDYSNTANLLIISDILISDYSSIIFEFSIMKKPILFYAYDVEEYTSDRGFYYNYYDFIPNKISYTTEEIIKAVINQEWYLERIEKFARYFFNPFDGNSTERVLKEVGLWEENK